MPYRYEVGVSISGYPTFALDYFGRGAFTIGTHYEPTAHNDDFLEYIYGEHHGPTYGTGCVQFEGSVYLNPWIIQTLNIGIGQYWSSSIDNRSGQKTGNDYGMSLTILPELKFIANRRHSVRFFCSIAAGTGLYMGNGFDGMRTHDRHPSGVHQRWELEWVPAGIMIGNKCSFFANIGIGSVYMGGRTGITYRF